ncbi:MAG TPA: uroporphyrinogen-III synthase [Candidatus Polarisedimenticolaceae bacterium]|nr:uroporphyrinogen-III synthase [Candidatus Polarisedimenticolaceae bacterium]
MRVLVTRPAGSWPELSRRFSGSGIEIEMGATTVQVEPLDPVPADTAIARLGSYSWIVVTSGQGVKALTLRLAARESAAPPQARWAAVGPATARALQGTGVRVDLVADDPRGEGLAAQLAPRLSVRERVLVVRPEGAAHTLLAPALRVSGARVDEAPLYRTIASPDAARLADDVVRGRFGAVVWTAPSALHAWLEAAPDAPRFKEALAGLRRIAIGPTTARALAAEGLPPDEVAEAPEAAQVGDAILRAAAKMPPPRGGPS